ncbi:unnamed protein product, partial [Pylaiella littoralis]
FFSRVTVLESKLCRHGIVMEERETNTHVIRRLSSLFNTQAEILLANPFATRTNIESVVLNKHGAMEMDSKRREMGEQLALVAAGRGIGGGGGNNGGGNGGHFMGTPH